MAVVGDEEELQVVFTQIDAQDPHRKFVIGVFVEEDDTYAGALFDRCLVLLDVDVFTVVGLNSGSLNAL